SARAGREARILSWVVERYEYLRWQIERFGMTPTAIRAYNRPPGRASESWPLDRYAEDVALNYFALVQRFDSLAGDATVP
ncbi:MAG: hypothetical protein AAB265_12990, partial [candidate division NC10 bacterium]